jgi:hypothetical protein
MVNQSTFSPREIPFGSTNEWSLFQSYSDEKLKALIGHLQYELDLINGVIPVHRIGKNGRKLKSIPFPHMKLVWENSLKIMQEVLSQREYMKQFPLDQIVNSK